MYETFGDDNPFIMPINYCKLLSKHQAYRIIYQFFLNDCLEKFSLS